MWSLPDLAEGETMTAKKIAASALVATGLSCMGAIFSVYAQDYPSRSVTLVVPFAPGGSLDIVGRMLGEQLSTRLGKAFAIENRPGGGTNVATTGVAKSAPDGHTLLITTSALAINATLYKKLLHDPVRDFAPLALVANVPLVLVVNSALPVRSVTDLIKLAKASPDRLSYASGGSGSAPHLFGELFKSLAGIEMIHVPYRGGSQAVTDLVAGHVQVMFADPGSVLPQMREGRIRALGVTSTTRLPVIPDIPPIAEAGVASYDAVSWQLLIAPAKTPPTITNRLHDTIKSITAQTDIKMRLTKLGLMPATSPSPEALRRFVALEVDRWGDVVRRIGIAGTE
jgi:tripartite-type tricarboxylate transporter receptor subunit TctC